MASSSVMSKFKVLTLIYKTLKGMDLGHACDYLSNSGLGFDIPRGRWVEDRAAQSGVSDK